MPSHASFKDQIYHTFALRRNKQVDTLRFEYIYGKIDEEKVYPA